MGRLTASLGLLFLATVPILFEHATLGYSNLPMMTYLVLGCLLCLIGIRRRQTGQILVGSLLLGLSAWTRIRERGLQSGGGWPLGALGSLRQGRAQVSAVLNSSHADDRAAMAGLLRAVRSERVGVARVRRQACPGTSRGGGSCCVRTRSRYCKKSGSRQRPPSLGGGPAGLADPPARGPANGHEEEGPESASVVLCFRPGGLRFPVDRRYRGGPGRVAYGQPPPAPVPRGCPGRHRRGARRRSMGDVIVSRTPARAADGMTVRAPIYSTPPWPIASWPWWLRALRSSPIHVLPLPLLPTKKPQSSPGDSMGVETCLCRERPCGLLREGRGGGKIDPPRGEGVVPCRTMTSS